MAALVPVVYLPQAKADAHQKGTGSHQQLSEENTELKPEFRHLDGIGCSFICLELALSMVKISEGKE